MKLIAIDMDGTLLGSDRTISQANIQAIEDATAKGHIVMICSGRPHDGILVFLKENNLSLPLSGSNGAITYTDNKVIHSATITHEVASQIFESLEEGQHPFKVYTNKGVYSHAEFFERAEKEYVEKTAKVNVHRMSLQQIKEYEEKFSTNKIASFKELEAIDGLEIFKFFVFTPQDTKKQTLRSTIESINGITITASGTDNTEIMGADGNKGTGITQMAKHYQIPIEDTVAIGDNFNDVAMLQVAGLSIAMGNAEEKVKELCDITTLTNDEDGVAYAIRKYVLKETV